MPTNNGILTALTKIAAIFVARMGAKIDQVNAPSGIKNGVAIGTATATSEGASIEITINHPAASAFEYGSGLTSELYPPRKYLITPKTGAYLAFPWEVAKNIPGPITNTSIKDVRFSKKTGKAVLPYVQHPGVKARPYIRPTIREMTDVVASTLTKALKADIFYGEKKIETIEVKIGI